MMTYFDTKSHVNASLTCFERDFESTPPAKPIYSIARISGVACQVGEERSVMEHEYSKTCQ